MIDVLVVLSVALPLLTGVLVQLARTPGQADAVNRGGAVVTAAAALCLAAIGLTEHGPRVGSWYLLDGASGAFIAVGAVVGLMSAVISPVYLAGAGRSFFSARRSRAFYYMGLHVFWAVLLALPLIGNLGVAWLLVEVSTGTSALLVAFSASRPALAAGWKYLVLTTFGLTISLLGIVILYAGLAPHGGSLATLDWSQIARHAGRLPRGRAVLAFVLIVGGLAAKIGWAPVHNWLPDAHSEAPAPVSAMLSAALLPTVVLIAWRTLATLGSAMHGNTGRDVFFAFGLASLAIAVPFLWRPLAWKRLLAYSSLEHMGVLALGIGFGSRLAIAGVVLHLAGHALAKALGFYTAIPLLRHQPSASRRPAVGVARGSAGVGSAVGISLGTLAGLPPGPLFFSELLILAGGLAAGELVVTVLAALLLALGFLGLAQHLIEGLLGGSGGRPWARGRTVIAVERLTAVVGVGLLTLSASAYLLLHVPSIQGLMGGLR